MANHHILSVLVENKFGVLTRVSSLFSRRGYNIYSLAVSPVSGSGVGFSVSSPSVTLAAGASTAVSVTSSAAQGASAGGKQAVLWVSSGGVPVAHAVLYTLVK